LFRNEAHGKFEIAAEAFDAFVADVEMHGGPRFVLLSMLYRQVPPEP
jgi:hypothetical protein